MSPYITIKKISTLTRPVWHVCLNGVKVSEHTSESDARRAAKKLTR